MTTSIALSGFQSDINEIFFKAKPIVHKKQIENRINDLYEEFCELVTDHFDNKDIISEARDYKNDAIKQLDKIIEKINNTRVPLDKEKI